MVLEITAKTGSNMRAEAKATATVLASIPMGVKINAAEYVNSWFKVSYEGKTGWVSTTYVKDVTPAPQPTSTPRLKPVEMFRVRKSWVDAASQIAAYTSLESAKEKADLFEGYTVFDNAGNAVYTPLIKQPSTNVSSPIETPQEAIVGQSDKANQAPTDQPKEKAEEEPKLAEELPMVPATAIISMVVFVVKFVYEQFKVWGWIREDKK